jgi:capsular exopolysaccharide synthesis family protein
MSNSNSPSDESYPAGEIDFRAIFFNILERAWIIAIALALTVGAAVIYILKTPKVYEAETVLQVEETARKVVNIQEVANEDLKTTEHLKTIELNLSNQVVLQGVLESLKLTPEQLGLASSSSGEPVTEGRMMRALAGSLSTKLQRGTRLISVKVENPDPELAQKISMQLVREFTHAYLEQRIGISNEASSFLVDERERLRQRVEESEKVVQDYKEANPGLLLDESQNLAESRLMALSNNLNEARATRFRLESDENQIRQIGTAQPLDLLRVNSVAAAPIVLEMQKVLSTAESDFAALTERYKSKHPKYVQAQKKVADLRFSFQRTIVEAAGAVSVSLKGARESEEKAAALLAEQEASRLQFSKVKLPYEALVKDMEADRDLYTSVQRRLKETEVTKSLDQESIRIVQPALVPDKPSKPRKALVLVGSVLVGLMLAAGFIFAQSLADDSIKTVDQAEEYLGQTVIGSIPKATKADLEAKALLTVKDPIGQIAESFRSLRAALSLTEAEGEDRVTLFTSAIPGEGKSFCSVNYAVSLAQLGQKTLIIDGDLRLPTVHKHFFEKPPEKGIGFVLEGKATLAESVTPSGIENLDVLTAGLRAAKPSELISQGAFRKVLKEAAKKYDRVIIDSAPIHAVSDSLLLLKDVNNVCLVICAAKTSRRLIARALQKIIEAKGRISGIVLNQLPKSGMNYYYYYSPGKYGDGVYGAAQESQA